MSKLKLLSKYFYVKRQINAAKLGIGICKSMKDVDFVQKYYKIVLDDGTVVQNPTSTSVSINLIVPVPNDIRVSNDIDLYVRDQIVIIENVLYKSGVGSLFNIGFKNMFVDGSDDELVVVVKWKLSIYPAIISILIYILMTSIVFLSFYV